MDSKDSILKTMKEEFARWDAFFAGLTPDEIRDTVLPGGLSYGDLACHLWAWQTRSIERMRAALENREPVFSGWPAHLVPEDEADLEPINAWIREQCGKKTWEQAYGDWRAQFQAFIAAVEALPEELLLEEGRFPWLWGRELGMIATASCEHHRIEHWEPLMEWRQSQN